MSLPEICAQYNIDMTSIDKMLVGLTEVYETKVKSYRDAKKDSVTQEIMAEWKARPRTETHTVLQKGMQEAAQAMFEEDPQGLAQLVDVFFELASYTRTLRNDAVRAANPNAPKVEVNVDELKEIQAGAQAAFNMCQQLQILPADYKVKTYTDGSVGPQLSKMPSVPDKSAPATTRAVSTKHLVYFVDGEQQVTNEMAVKLGPDFQPSRLFDLGQKATDGKASKGGWSIEVSGKVVEAKIVDK